ncbi:unnamed protein product [Rotaria sp. Silwood1]|nr:unnamed protein product [Rotaria sp. Silwood1]CAF1445083.1 unnamed protein product [Rotaria sp. Silwood1]CAF3609922.1 unnamed protein product [Rotaria sp. Silwood1]CAF3708727.1 unnamed protein product [Rotaria sp. Silwood1]CAF3718804.1 unnamed protein product [Rotaria sp. Silwood1]
MTESYLTTDIIVIIVLVVVLVLVGVGAFFIHFYWTKIGVSEIWNTAKWSSMRSSMYQTIRRFSRGNTSKFTSERPYSGTSIYTNDIDDDLQPPPPPPPSDTIQEKKLNPNITTYIPSPNNYSSNRKLEKLPSTIAYKTPISQNYGTKIGQPIENTIIYNIHEHNNPYNEPSPYIEKHRF